MTTPDNSVRLILCGEPMEDITVRLERQAREPKQDDAALLREAAAEIKRLRIETLKHLPKVPA